MTTDIFLLLLAEKFLFLSEPQEQTKTNNELMPTGVACVSSAELGSIVVQKLLIAPQWAAQLMNEMFHYYEHKLWFMLSQSHVHFPAAVNTTTVIIL